MFKTINLLLTAICFFTIGNAQVKTNFNNPQKVNTKGRFVKEYATKFLELAPPDLSSALRRDQFPPACLSMDLTRRPMMAVAR